MQYKNIEQDSKMSKYTSYFDTALDFLQTISSAQMKINYELEYQKTEMDRQAILAANLPLPDFEVEAFWCLYYEYRTAIKEMDDQQVTLMERFATLHKDIDDGDGGNFVMDALQVEKKRQTLKGRYLKKFARVLRGQRLFRYYQIETKFDAVQRFAWISSIPLVPVLE